MVTRPQGRPGDRVYCEPLLQMQIAVLSESADIRVVVSGCRNAGTCRGVCVFKLAKHLQLEELEASKGRPTCPLKEPLDNTEVGVPQASFKFHWHGQRGSELASRTTLAASCSSIGDGCRAQHTVSRSVLNTS